MTTETAPQSGGPRPRSEVHLPSEVGGNSTGRAPRTSLDRVRTQRRPLLVAVMVVLACAGGLLSGYAFLSLGDAHEVVAVRQSVARGEVIGAADLMTVRIGVDPAVSPIDASKLSSLVGQRAATDLPAGSLVTAQSVTNQVVPASDESLVGVSLTSAQMPSEPLLAGDVVRLAFTPSDQGEAASAEPVTISATVVGVRTAADTGQTVVDVSVAKDEAAQLAVQASVGQVALILDSRVR